MRSLTGGGGDRISESLSASSAGRAARKWWSGFAVSAWLTRSTGVAPLLFGCRWDRLATRRGLEAGGGPTWVCGCERIALGDWS